MKVRTALIILLALVSAPIAAMAQTTPAPVTASAADAAYVVTGYYNVNFGGGLFKDRSTGTSGGGGGSLIFWGREAFSTEVDVNYNPKFFGTTGDLGSNSLMTFTVNGLFGPWMGPNKNIRPYALLGGGMLRGSIASFADNNMSTSTTMGVFDIGGGVFYFFTPKFGSRFDIRYRVGLGASTDPATGWGLLEDWNYMRATFGLTYAF